METHYVRVGAVAGTDEETRASFDARLNSYWESGDEIEGLMGLMPVTIGNPTVYSKTYSGTTLSIESGSGTNRAVFGGSMNNPSGSKDAQYFHFIYPAHAGELSMRINPGVKPNHPVTCSITIPAEQNGRWIPYMWATTGDRTTWDNLSKVRFNALSGALAIRVYENDRETPKPLSEIRVRATGSGDRLVGTFTQSTNDVLTADNFTCSAAGNTIIATGLEAVEMLDGRYEYRLNVAPGTVEGLELTLIGADGSQITRHANGKEFKANTRSGLNVYWDDATISLDRAASWYEDQTLEGGKLYLGATVAGASAGAVKELGYTIGGTDYPVTPGLKSEEQIALPAGRYTVEAYATVNGKRIVSSTREVIVTPIPTLTNEIRTSCTKNGTRRTTNALSGNQIEATYTLSDPFFAQLLAAVKLESGAGTLGDLTQGPAVTVSALGSYANCRVVATLQNGYSFEGAPFDATLSGIPYNYQFYGKNNNDVAQQGWVGQNTQWSSSYLDIINQNAYVTKQFNPTGTESVSYTLNIKYYNVTSKSGTVYLGTAAALNGSSDKSSSHSIKSTLQTGTSGRTNLSGAVTISPSAPCLVISHNNPAGRNLGLYAIDLKYTHPDE